MDDQYQNLREFRTTSDLSQNELSDRIGITQQHISGIEAGERTLVPEQAIRLAKYLDTDGERLFVNHVFRVIDQQLKKLKDEINKDDSNLERLWKLKTNTIDLLRRHFNTLLHGNVTWPDNESLKLNSGDANRLYGRFLDRLNEHKNRLTMCISGNDQSIETISDDQREQIEQFINS